MLTKNEKMLIADALNGCGTLIAADPEYLNLMAGSEGALADAEIVGQDAWGRIELTGRVCSGLEHEVYDAIRLDQLDEKWSIDGPELVNKIAAMSVEDRNRLVQAVAAIWDRNDANFERDLETLQV